MRRDNIAIMRTSIFDSNTVVSFLNRHKVATLEQISEAMGDASNRTVFRNLKQLEYLSSYSHRGKYYTLKSIADFSGTGLWSMNSVWFSRFGTLLETVAAWVHESKAGYSAAELTTALCVECKHALTRMHRQNRIQRNIVANRYIYFSSDKLIAESQQQARMQNHVTAKTTSIATSDLNLAIEEAKATVLLFYSLLNEKQRRLYAGLESLKLGYGGDKYIASLLGMNPHTVARGRKELESGNLSTGRVRAQGGGRLLQEKKLQK